MPDTVQNPEERDRQGDNNQASPRLPEQQDKKHSKGELTVSRWITRGGSILNCSDVYKTLLVKQNKSEEILMAESTLKAAFILM